MNATSFLLCTNSRSAPTTMFESTLNHCCSLHQTLPNNTLRDTILHCRHASNKNKGFGSLVVVVPHEAACEHQREVSTKSSSSSSLALPRKHNDCLRNTFKHQSQSHIKIGVNQTNVNVLQLELESRNYGNHKIMKLQTQQTLKLPSSRTIETHNLTKEGMWKTWRVSKPKQIQGFGCLARPPKIVREPNMLWNHLRTAQLQTNNAFLHRSSKTQSFKTKTLKS